MLLLSAVPLFVAGLAGAALATLSDVTLDGNSNGVPTSAPGQI